MPSRCPFLPLSHNDLSLISDVRSWMPCEVPLPQLLLFLLIKPTCNTFSILPCQVELPSHYSLSFSFSPSFLHFDLQTATPFLLIILSFSFLPRVGRSVGLSRVPFIWHLHAANLQCQGVQEAQNKQNYSHSTSSKIAGKTLVVASKIY